MTIWHATGTCTYCMKFSAGSRGLQRGGGSPACWSRENCHVSRFIIIFYVHATSRVVFLKFLGGSGELPGTPWALDPPLNFCACSQGSPYAVCVALWPAPTAKQRKDFWLWISRHGLESSWEQKRNFSGCACATTYYGQLGSYCSQWRK